MIAWLLINYNGEEITSHNFNLLISAGVKREDIYIADNGSSRLPEFTQNVLRLPENVKFRSVADIALRYLKTFKKYKGFVILTNSAELLPNVDYCSHFYEFLDDSKIGFVVASLVGDKVETYSSEQAYALWEAENEPLSEIYHPQPIVTFLSRSFIQKLQDEKMAYFNEDLIHGWGIDREMRLACDIFGFKGLVTFHVWAVWNNNLIHKLGRAGQARDKYWSEAEKEMRLSFSKRYGANWERLFLTKYNERTETNRKASSFGFIYNYYRLLKSLLG